FFEWALVREPGGAGERELSDQAFVIEEILGAVDRDEMFNAAQPRFKRDREREEMLVRNQRLAFGVVDDGNEFIGGQSGIEWDDHGADLEAGVYNFEELRAVQQIDRDPIAAPRAQFVQRLRERPRPRPQFAITLLAAIEDRSSVVGEIARGASERLIEK